MKKIFIAGATFTGALALCFVSGQILSGIFLLSQLGMSPSSVSWHTVSDIQPLLTGNNAMLRLLILSWIIRVAPVLFLVVITIMAAVVLSGSKKPSLHGDARFATANDLHPLRYVGPYLPSNKK